MGSIISHSVAETAAFAASCLAPVRPGEIFALTGPLGTGKTHFVKGLAAALGIDPDSVTSPTFTLVHEYVGGALPLFHFDFYRLESPIEVLDIGWDDYLAAGGVAAVEWADKFPSLLPSMARWIDFAEASSGGREIRERLAP